MLFSLLHVLMGVDFFEKSFKVGGKKSPVQRGYHYPCSIQKGGTLIFWYKHRCTPEIWGVGGSLVQIPPS
jgi:hypothetical protein